jgi:Leucine-rich repeat (LRR) protein
VNNKNLEELNLLGNTITTFPNGLEYNLLNIDIEIEKLSKEVKEKLKLSLVYNSLELALKSPELVYVLNLGNKELKSLPLEIVKLVNLEKLYLYSNRFNSIPKEIAQLKNLQVLNMNRNIISSISDEISE